MVNFIMIYMGIFLFKIVEDALATLRLIVVSNGKKVIGSILQFIVTIIWIILTGYVLIDFMDDIFKIIAFSLGALVGSYVGSTIEEKIALGTNSFIVKINNIDLLCNSLKNKGFDYMNINDETLIILAPRRKRKEVIKIVKGIDKDSVIISEKIKIFSDL